MVGGIIGGLEEFVQLHSWTKRHTNIGDVLFRSRYDSYFVIDCQTLLWYIL